MQLPPKASVSKVVRVVALKSDIEEYSSGARGNFLHLHFYLTDIKEAGVPIGKQISLAIYQSPYDIKENF